MTNEENGQLSPEAHAQRVTHGVVELLDSVGAVVWECDVEGLRPRWVSAGIERLLGRPQSYWLRNPESWHAAIHPDDLSLVRELCRKAMTSGETQEFQHRLRNSAGEVLWVRQIVGPAGDGHSDLRVRGVMLDITPRKRAEEALRESEERIRQITENISEVLWITDATTYEVLYVSPAYEAIFGYPPSELTANSSRWLEGIHPHDRERVLTAMRQSQFGRRYDEEVRIVRPGGGIRWIHSRGFPVFNDKGEVYRVVGVAEDITDRREAELASRESAERFQFVAQATTDVLWDWDIEGETVWWSSGYQTQLGYAESGTLPAEESWIENIHPDDRDLVSKSVYRARELRKPSWSGRYRFRRADGTYLHVLDRGFFKFDAEGKPVRMVGAMVDVGRQQQLESQLEQMKRVASLGTLAANMAHEFNNVLMGIQPFADVVRRLVPDHPRVQEAVNRINQSIARGRKVTDVILRFTRPVEPLREPVLVRDWLNDFRPEAEALVGGKARLEMHLADESLLVKIDVAEMNQVLANLIINARDVSPVQGVVRLNAWRDRNGISSLTSSDYVHITVEDEGPGVPAELLERIFEPLFTTRKSGTGLGLAVSNQVVTAHDGRIYAENREGGGACFHVILPVAGEEAQPNTDDYRTAPALPRRVVIVDDEPDVAAGLEALLRMEGVDVWTVDRGAESLDAIRDHAPEAVLLDIALPDMNGPEVYRLIAEENPGQRVIFMSGHYNRKDLEPLLALPQVEFLQKPFTRDDLFRVLQTSGGGGMDVGD